MINDLRYAIRGLLRTPGFTIAAVLTLGVGIGIHTAIFGMVDALMFRPLPYSGGDRLVNLHGITDPVRRSFGSGIPRETVSTWASQTDLVSGIAMHRVSGRMVLQGTGGDTIYGAAIAPGFMKFLGVDPLLGREFAENETEIDLAILSYAFWISMFAGDENVLGRAVTLDGRPFTIVGVMPGGFYFPLSNPAQVWTPLSVRRPSVSAVGRLRVGLSAADAQRRADSLAVELQKAIPREDRWLVLVRSFSDARLPSTLRLALWLLISAVGLVVLVACANVAALFLGRVFDRMRELAVRAALGATRAQLVRTMMMDAVVVAGLGVCAALVLSRWSTDAAGFMLPSQVADAGLNHRVVAFAIGLGLFASFLCVLGPAVPLLRRDFSNILCAGHRAGTNRPIRGRAYGVLVAGELALTFMLLFGTALLANSFIRLTAVDVGFDTTNLALVNVQLQKNRYPTRDLEDRFYREAIRRARLVPGVVEVTAGGDVPPRTGVHYDITLPGAASGAKADAATTSVAPN
jgi:putative ABC transport system permease protein